MRANLFTQRCKSCTLAWFHFLPCSGMNAFAEMKRKPELRGEAQPVAWWD